MSIKDFLIDENKWIEFLEHKNSIFINEKEYAKLKEYIDNKKYLDLANLINQDKYIFSIPYKRKINKNNSNKKRIIYSFSYDENIILKMIQYLLNEYDHVLEDNCYSFRINNTTKQAFSYITKKSKNMYGYKLDIKNYFNSISIPILLNILKENLKEDDYTLIESITKSDKAIDFKTKEIIKENKGAMAGCPISCFLSNIYLKDLDYHFKDKIYARYADDIIIFNKSMEELKDDITYIHEFLKKMHLEINQDKENFILPNEPFHFLGFNYQDGKISLAEHTIHKMKKKLKRKAKALRRWAKRKNIPYEKAAIGFIKIFNYKFFHEKKDKELNWSLWYFPTINDTNGLHIIDIYYQECIRYILTGKYKKSNKWKVPYPYIKSLGYRSLINEYYKYKKIHK